ncbi:hypothetical protein [Microbulbifer halophilus]
MARPHAGPGLSASPILAGELVELCTGSAVYRLLDGCHWRERR